MAVTEQDIFDSLIKCSAYAPQLTPQPSEVVVEAWLEHFEQFPRLTRENLLEAVKVYFQQPRDRQIQPADISRVARDLRAREVDKWDVEARARYEAICDAKAAPESEALPSSSGAGAPELDSGTTLTPEQAEAVAEARRRAVAEFAAGYRQSVPTEPTDKVRDLVERQRSAAPPQAMDPDCVCDPEPAIPKPECLVHNPPEGK